MFREEKSFLSMFKRVRKNNTEENRQSMVRARTEYKNTVRKFNFEIDKQKSMKLINAKFKNAKEYWKLLKESVSQPNKNQK